MSAYRVVMPRSLPFAESNRVQRESWRRGYSTRLDGRDAAVPGNQVVEFMRIVEELPDPTEVSTLAEELDVFLERRDARATLPTGRDRLWVEPVRDHQPHRA